MRHLRKAQATAFPGKGNPNDMPIANTNITKRECFFK